MTPIIRNLISVVRRFKLATALNILGLSVAFAAFMVIMIQLDYDLEFDRFHKDYDKIFRMEFIQGGTEASTIFSRPLAENFFESSPYIVAGAISDTWTRELFFHVENNNGQIYFNEISIRVSPQFFDVFTFDFVEGSKNTLKTPENIIIPLSLSHKLFGQESALGRQILFNGWYQTVGAVYRDFPTNSILNNHIFTLIPENENKNNWNRRDYQAYIRVNEASNAPFLFENFKRYFDLSVAFGFISDSEWRKVDIRLTALPEIHFVTGVQWDETPKSSRHALMILFVIAIMIVAIAAINFTNFSTALTPMRIKSINTHRVLGAQRSTIRWSIVSEAVFFSLLSFFVAFWLVILFKITPLAKLVDADLSLAVHTWIVGVTALVALFAALFAGVYPSLYITSFAPSLVLKGSFCLSPKGKKNRNTLIGIQYIVSFALIIGASFLYLQNRFMQKSPLGYDKDMLLTVNIRQIQRSRDAFTNQIKKYAEIEDVTYAHDILSSSDSYSRWRLQYKGEDIEFKALAVHHSFLKVMGIELTEGRNFRYEDSNVQQRVWIFNETAQRKFNLELNTSIDGWAVGEIIGFMPDIKFASFRSSVEPMAFYEIGNAYYTQYNAYIKLKAGSSIHFAMLHIKSTLTEFDPNFPFEIRFFDEVLQKTYEKEIALSTLITLFSFLAIFISIVGVFGLVFFDSECRRKEIGIRKVFGASAFDIIAMFNKIYIKILVVCFVIAAPLTWYAVSRWLENFSYKTPLYWWVYLLAFVVVGVITICTVTFQTWRVANDDPVLSIKSE